MKRPEFSAVEKYVLADLRARESRSTANPYLWGYLVGGAIIAGIAVYDSNLVIMGLAFLFVCGFRLYEERHSAKYTPVWTSIIDKYEAALDDSPVD